ncbi:uncharacterized protein LOC110737190 [Chenopodium quinoa]|uniref:uncharacterized protein LOC110737190 n=1 Tax=Chenopodium quinoa TaxID=63459 RepID=UPI000B791D86|nr:uncharacterized protein LOC110737190 [Chenopodium quinoa]
MVNCACGFPCTKRHSWTHENPGRRFEACKKYNHDTGERGCNTFKWLDEEQTEWQREMINVLLAERHRLETKLTIVKARLACLEDHNNLQRGMQRGFVPEMEKGGLSKLAYVLLFL